MKTRPAFDYFILSALILLIGIFYTGWMKRFEDPFPSLTSTLSISTTQLEDFFGAAFGLRRLTADLMWVETLQYYGTEETNVSEFDSENGGGKYPQFLSYCERVIKMDPHFIYVYYYGACALAWNLNRYDDAETLIKEGIKANPKEWRLAQYLAGMSYQKNHDQKGITQFLESFLYNPDCPNLLRSMLAHLYKKQGRYRDAIRVWFVVLDSHDARYRFNAEVEIPRLAKLAGIGPRTH